MRLPLAISCAAKTPLSRRFRESISLPAANVECCWLMLCKRVWVLGGLTRDKGAGAANFRMNRTPEFGRMVLKLIVVNVLSTRIVVYGVRGTM